MIKKYFLCLGALTVFVLSGISISLASVALADNITSNRITPNLTDFLSHSTASEPELPRGVPFVVHLSYKNGSFLSTGPVDYSIKFDFGENFVVSDLRKGTFDNATLVTNDTVKFHSGPIVKGENKTGVILFSFENGLAEKKRSAAVTTNVTVQGLDKTVGEMGLTVRPVIENNTGTFATPTLFSNGTLFNTITGINFEPSIRTFVDNLSINTLRNGLVNLSLPQIASTFNVLQPERANLLIRSVPPIAPSNTTTATSSFVVNSSYVDLISSIVNLTNGILVLGEKTYTAISPCLSLGEIKFFEPSLCCRRIGVYVRVKNKELLKSF